MKTMLAIMIVVLLLVGTLAFTLPTLGTLQAPAQPSAISTIDGGAHYVPFIACSVGPCGCPDC